MMKKSNKKFTILLIFLFTVLLISIYFIKNRENANDAIQNANFPTVEEIMADFQVDRGEAEEYLRYLIATEENFQENKNKSIDELNPDPSDNQKEKIELDKKFSMLSDKEKEECLSLTPEEQAKFLNFTQEQRQKYMDLSDEERKEMLKN